MRNFLIVKINGKIEHEKLKTEGCPIMYPKINRAENKNLSNYCVYEALLCNNEVSIIMAANYRLITFIMQTSSVTRIFFNQMFCTDVSNI